MIKIEAGQIDAKQWLSALHVKGEADGLLKSQMEKAEELLLAAAKPRAVYRVMERSHVITAGHSIEKHLEGCHQVVIMAVTLGAEADGLIRKTQITDMAMAVIMDAGASVLIEQVCDDFENHIKQQFAGEPLYFTSRFSPGYGDYPVTEQRRILRYLDASGKIGLNLTADSLMIPRKSITVLMGAAEQPVAGRMAGCDECVLKEKCTLRKEGKFCGDRL